MRSIDETLGANVRQRRDVLGMPVRELSARMGELDVPMVASVITKIEQGQRPVRVAELVAFARALETTPTWLMMPDVGPEEDAGAEYGHARGGLAWAWLRGQHPLAGDVHPHYVEEFQRQVHPAWFWRSESHPLVRAADQVKSAAVIAAKLDRPKQRSAFFVILRAKIDALLAEIGAQDALQHAPRGIDGNR